MRTSSGSTASVRSGRLRGRWLALITVALSGSLLVGELVLRSQGREPWQGRAAPEKVQLYVEDDELGWRLRPGRHLHPGYGGGPIRITVLADGSRASHPKPAHTGPWVALLGGSFIQGWGLSDEDTLAWRLQESHPGWRVSNHGVGGYGTYQSLLVLERLLAASERPSLVLYGFIPLHEVRNVAEAGWLESLARAGRSGLAAAPSATLDAQGALVRHPPRRHPRWPLRERLALAAFGEWWVARLSSAGRGEQARDVTLELLAEMNQRCAEHGVDFAVVALWARPRARVPYREGADPSVRTYRGDLYAPALRAEGVRMLDCSHEITPELTIPGEGHPGPELNAYWADCLSPELDRLPPAG